ncbi:2-alkyl-3-oxoalkanoate reductase [Shewanella waksmanii]|uniref:2-alkyl-3-oxoalkanoate reductase n=1 Tax=Shewanella waksmanii TaxID=213783 RepID=UPI003735F350
MSQVTLNSTITIESLHPLEQQALVSLNSSVKHAFVTGAGGFLGKAICVRLLAAGIAVTGFARGDYPELQAMGVNMISGDIADLGAVEAAMQGCDVIFHVASKAGVWGSKASYYSPNVDGVANIINAAKKHNITHLVYTSTPSVTFAGVDEQGIDESAPYANRYLNFYAESKAKAEQMVCQASGTAVANGQRLQTVSIRPHLIWGPEDPHLVPRVIERARLGKLKLVGKQDKLVDTIFVENAAYAHVLAALALTKNSPTCAGKAYFVSNDEPITMAAMLNKILACVDLPPVTKRVPAPVAYAAGFVLETVYSMLGKAEEPMMTRFVARQLSTSHYFNIDAIKRDLGYQSIVSIDEGMKKLTRSLQR